MPYGPDAQHRVEQPLGPDARLELGQQRLGVRRASRRSTSRATSAVERVDVDVRPLARDDAGEPQQRPPLVLLAGLEREHGGE